ncbi:MAG: ribosome silencing factor [Cyclobacteriaceae bacterium]|nr:ribosome silencing factor [Cyclobacteriaceae bacterium]MCK5370202.1 ribosome silencing factor [Cyclobacteriaceae bacterium]MCK5702112.1 ribosome silencing factor [Cyclobacteriaceae bacterium]
MIKESETVSSEKLSKYIVKGIQEKKGADIVILNLKDIGNAIADHFVICTGASDTQVDAISESVEKEVLKGADEKPWHREGFQNKEWILLDYVNVVVHIFKNNVRSFYGLEELWGDAAITRVEDQ